MSELRYSLVRTVEPALPVMTLQEAKDHLRVDSSAEDSAIEPLVDAAASYLEDICNRAFVTQTLALRLDEAPDCDCICLPRYPLIAVSSISYVDTSGVTQTWAASNYIVDPYGKPGRIALAYGAVWPVVQDVINAMTITYTAGHGANPEAVPRDLIVMVKLLLTHWYEHRELINPMGDRGELPFALNAQIWKHRVWM